MRFMDRPPVCPQLRTPGLSPPSGVCESVPHLLGKTGVESLGHVAFLCVSFGRTARPLSNLLFYFYFLKNFN